MKRNMIYLCALLLIGAASRMTAGAQTKPTLAVFVVGNEAIGASLTTVLGTNLTSGGRYALTTALTSGKLAELKAAYTVGGGSSINRDALAEWGRANGISAICLVVDDVKGSDHLFSAQLINTKDSQLEGKGSYVRTGVGSGEVARVSLALVKQLEGPGRKRNSSTTVRSYPAELDIEMIFVEGGTFQMGCQDNECYGDGREKPVHAVTVSNFNIGKYEVTRAQWIAVMKDYPVQALRNPGNWKDDDQLPIEMVSWWDVDTAFLPQLNALAGRTTKAAKYRLPTEAEWEYAARGGKHKSSYKYSGNNNIDEVAWYPSNSGSKTRVVGRKNPNALGIYDMSGNVMEWCSDFYGTYSSTAQTNPIGLDPSKYPASTDRLRRGGDCTRTSNFCRVAFRSNANPDDREVALGFRLALPAQ
jgi:formylglycine-generating enzyme required for sulfatase activity